MVAPYEADAQLGYLSKINYIDVVCTEDSDLIVYGCKEILFKLDNNGDCKSLKYDNIFMDNINSRYNFTNFTQDMFTNFCVLCGKIPFLKSFRL